MCFPRAVVLLAGLSCGSLGALATGAQEAGLAAPQAVTGPFIGGVLQTSATVWFRVSPASIVSLQYRQVGKVGWQPLGTSVTTSATSDYTGQLTMTGLTGTTRYEYQLLVGGVAGPSAFFQTAPGDTVAKAFSFSVLSDFEPTHAPTLVSATADALHPDFVLMIGDLDHSNPGTDQAKALNAMRAMRLRLRTPAVNGGTDFGTDFVSALSPVDGGNQVPLYDVWDDHDYCYNNADRTCPSRDAGLQVLGEYFVPGRVSPGPRTGGYQRVRFGRLAEIFMLDARSGRDPDDHDAGTDESMLGATQLAWLTDAITTSDAAWKFVISPVPFNPTTKSWDSWAAGSVPGQTLSFQAERKTLATLFAGKKVVIFSGDIHSGGAIDDGTNAANDGLFEVSVPDANTGTFVNTFLKNGKPDPDQPHWAIGRDGPAHQADQGWPLDGAPNGVPDPGFVHVKVTPQSSGGPQVWVRVLDQAGALKHTPAGVPLQLCFNGPCS